MSLHASEARSHRKERRLALADVFARHPAEFEAHRASWIGVDDDVDAVWDAYLLELGLAFAHYQVEQKWTEECRNRCAFKKADPHACGCSGCIDSIDAEPHWWNRPSPDKDRAYSIGLKVSARARAAGFDSPALIRRLLQAAGT